MKLLPKASVTLIEFLDDWKRVMCGYLTITFLKGLRLGCQFAWLKENLSGMDNDRIKLFKTFISVTISDIRYFRLRLHSCIVY